jgi:dihydrofolate synthase/folylpolyglutamate synthase
VIIDAAHNPHGVAALVRTITEEFDFSSIITVVAPMGDKDVRGILEGLDEIADRVVVTANSSPRSAAINDVEALAHSIYGPDRVTSIPTLTEAIVKAVEQAKLDNDVNDENCAVLITGSVVTAGEARAILRRMSSRESSEVQ